MGVIADQLVKRKRKRGKRESDLFKRESVRTPDSLYARSGIGMETITKPQSTAAFLAEARRRGK